MRYSSIAIHYRRHLQDVHAEFRLQAYPLSISSLILYYHKLISTEDSGTIMRINCFIGTKTSICRIRFHPRVLYIDPITFKFCIETKISGLKLECFHHCHVLCVHTVVTGSWICDDKLSVICAISFWVKSIVFFHASWQFCQTGVLRVIMPSYIYHLTYWMHTCISICPSG